MTALHDAVENGVGDGRIADPGVPVFNRQLAGDDRRLVGGTVVDDLSRSERVVLSIAPMPQSSRTRTSVLAS